LYGPGLTVVDLNLGIFYLLAVSSLSTYGILLAGWEFYSKSKGLSYNRFTNFIFCDLSNLIKYYIIYIFIKYMKNLIINIINIIFKLFKRNTQSKNNNLLFANFNKKPDFLHFQKRNIHTTRFLNFKEKSKDYNIDNIKDLHSEHIKELYKVRKANVKPFNKELILATCDNVLDKNKKLEFLKEWGSKSCIYLIQYKYDPCIYYIGRTTLLKRRLYNHLNAETNSKFHLLLNLIGWEHFNISIIEVCDLDKLVERENYFIQYFLPLLNSVFSSTISETSINITLKDILNKLKPDNLVKISKNIPIYVYTIDGNGIDINYTLFSSLSEASRKLKINIASISQYKDTPIPFKGKLFYTQPILDFIQVFEASKLNTPETLTNEVLAIKVWAYDAKTLELINNAPFESKISTSKFLGISRAVIDYFIDTGKAEGVKGTYLYSKPLTNAEVKKLKSMSENLQLGNKKKVWAYDAKTLNLITNKPFISLEEAAKYFNINYRTVKRHLDTKLATMQNGKLVFLFQTEISLDLLEELKNNKLNIASYSRSEIWVYNINENKELVLLPNQPFLTKREAIKELGIHISILNKHLNTYKDYKGKLFFSEAQNK